ncbi:MAG: di-heme oxidoredictase family protein [Pseudomonadota bacterium]
MISLRLSASIVLVTSAALFGATANSQTVPWAEVTPAVGKIAKLPTGVLTKEELEQLTDIGEELFIAKFTAVDGAGRPKSTQAIIPTKPRKGTEIAFSRTAGPDANACSSCHNDPAVGGAGDFVTNVFVSEGFTNADFDTTDPQFSNERGTNHLFGAGLVELLAREMTDDLHEIRQSALAQAVSAGEPVTVDLETKGVRFGSLTAMPDGIADLSKIEGIDSDLVVRPFSQKGVMTSLRQFTVNAMNHHHGMQAVERFGPRWTGSDDFDEDGRSAELAAADISALVAWQATLPNPTRMQPEQVAWTEAAENGQELFSDIGCSDCHVPALPLKSLKFIDPGPMDASGTLNISQVAEPAVYDLQLLEWTKQLERNKEGEILVPLFGDLKRHVMTDVRNEQLGNELLSQRFVDRNIFMTAELWGVRSTAPYGHRNDFSTLDEIILAHGGDAREAQLKYRDADDSDRSAIIAFLRTMVILP